MTTPIVLSLGELLWDMLPSGKRAGGAPVNFAYHAKMNGADGWSISAVGEDALGDELLAEAEKAGITLPIEQTKVWSGFQADIDGRTPWGDYLIKRDGELVAVISFIDFETHGYHYLRSMHGPAWVAKPTEAEEREVVDAIVDTVKKADKSIAFLRIDTWFADGTEKVLSTVPYDQTVVIDITGGDDEILARMKRRGRRDVRKSLRECPAEVADETDKALTDFSEYYDVMVETGQRDGFTGTIEQAGSDGAAQRNQLDVAVFQ